MTKLSDKNGSLGYLSAAPRVSTRPEAELGGPRSHVLGVMNAFKSLGWAVKPFIVGDQVPLEWVVKGSEKALRRNPLRTLAADGVRVVLGVHNARRAWRDLGQQVDVVYERFAAFQALGGIFKRHRIPWILETNAPLFIESKHDRQTIILTGLAEYLERRAYHSCDVLVCISQALKEILVQQLQIDPQKIVVMPNGVDIHFFDPANYQANRLHDGLTIGFVGSLIAWQGLNLLIEAVAELKHGGHRLNLTFVGDGPARSALTAQAQALGLADQVAFVGYVAREQVPSYIAGFDMGYSGPIQLKAGRMYLSPLKLYEYMAMARPALAADFEDARRVVQPKQTGLLFESGNKSTLKTALREAIAHQGELARWGQQARQMMVDHHSWEARVEHLLQAAETILPSG